MCRSHKDGIEFKSEKCKYEGVKYRRRVWMRKKKEEKKLKIGRKWNMVGEEKYNKKKSCK